MSFNFISIIQTLLHLSIGINHCSFQNGLRLILINNWYKMYSIKTPGTNYSIPGVLIIWISFYNSLRILIFASKVSISFFAFSILCSNSFLNASDCFEFEKKPMLFSHNATSSFILLILFNR